MGVISVYLNAGIPQVREFFYIYTALFFLLLPEYDNLDHPVY